MNEFVAQKALFGSLLKGRLTEAEEQTLLGNNLTSLVRVYLSCPGNGDGTMTWTVE